jgi:hypothetical protein
MTEAPPPLKGVTAGLVLVGYSAPVLWVLFVWATFGILVEGPAFPLGWQWDALCVAWPRSC